MSENYKLIVDLHRGGPFIRVSNSLHDVLELLNTDVKKWYDSGITEMTTLVLPDGKEIETYVRIKKYCSNAIKNTPHLVSFGDLALGARFMYEDETENVWVKLSSNGTIARWEPDNATTKWVAQPICSLNDTGEDQLVQFIK